MRRKQDDEPARQPPDADASARREIHGGERSVDPPNAPAAPADEQADGSDDKLGLGRDLDNENR